jgi:hypothetical protein
LDGPLRKNAAIDEELAELDPCLQTLQRDIAAKRLAQGSDQGRGEASAASDNLRNSGMLDLLTPIGRA